MSATDISSRAAVDGVPDALALLLARAERHRLLRPEEERELSRRIERGDLAAKDRLVEANLRLVFHVARGYRDQGLPLADLVQEGMLGLIRAAEKFDHRRGCRFSTYAMGWFRQAIGRGLANQARTIRLPVHEVEKLRRVVAAERRLSVELGRDPTLDELGAAAGLTADAVARVRRAAQAPVSLDEPRAGDGDVALGDVVADERAVVEEPVLALERDETVRRVVGALPAAERAVVVLRFGLVDARERTAKATAAELGLSARDVRELEREALERLEHELRAHDLGVAA